MKFTKNTLAIIIAVMSANAVQAATTDTAYINTSPNTNIVIGIQGQDESVKVYDLDQIDSNTSAISNESASRVAADLDLQGQVTRLDNGKADKLEVANVQGEINALSTTKADKADVDATNASQQTQITNNTNEIIKNQKENETAILMQRDRINATDSRVTALENQPKPKDGANGKDGVNGAKGDKGDTGAQGKQGIQGVNGTNGKNGLNGITTTITKSVVDTQTQNKVATTAKQVFNNSQAISKMNNSFSSLKDEVNDNRKESNAGIAGAMAVAGLPQVNANQKFMVSAGAGTFNGESAVAVGASFNVNDNVVVKAGVSDDTQSNFGGNVGVGFGF